MIWGMKTSTFTELHVPLSLVGIASGLIVMIGLLRGRGLAGWTVIFLLSLLATSVTGFAFPVERLLPSHQVGMVSLVVLAVAALARSVWHLQGAWRSVYVVAAAAALYLDVLVAVAQAFAKVPARDALAQHRTEPPSVAAQRVAPAVVVVLPFRAVRRFRRAAPLSSLFFRGGERAGAGRRRAVTPPSRGRATMVRARGRRCPASSRLGS